MAGARVVLGDGRIVETWEGGDPAGIPVIYHHATPSGRLQAALAAASAGGRPGDGHGSTIVDHWDDMLTTLVSGWPGR